MATKTRGIDVSWIGDKELSAMLKNLPLAAQQKVMKPALEKAAQPVIQAARGHLRRIMKTGAHTDPIRAALKIDPIKRSRKHVGYVVWLPGREKLGIKGRWYYPIHIELGTVKNPALPYMRPAMRENREKCLKIVADEIKRNIARVAINAKTGRWTLTKD